MAKSAYRNPNARISNFYRTDLAAKVRLRRRLRCCRTPRKPVRPVLVAALVLLGAVNAFPDPGSAQDIGRKTFGLSHGYVAKNCTWNEAMVLKQSHDILFTAITTGYGNLVNCMTSAALVEFSCHIAQSAMDAASQLRNYQAYTTIECANLGPNILGQAPVSIEGERLKMSRAFLATGTPRAIAATIAHEIMHNRGWRHKQNDFGSLYYSNTIPEQMEACIQFNTPNAAMGPAATTWITESCDGSIGVSGYTQRQGMHACPVGRYLSGVRLDHNMFLCRQQPGFTYTTGAEFIRRSGGYSEANMAACPPGHAVTGLHESKNLLLCAPYATANRMVDPSTQRAGMHSCPQGRVMTGLHAGNNQLLCQ